MLWVVSTKACNLLSSVAAFQDEPPRTKIMLVGKGAFQCRRPPSPRFLNDVTVKAAEDVLHPTNGDPLASLLTFCAFLPKWQS